jgi:hypothetical protein
MMTTNLQPLHDSSASLHDSPGFVAQRVRDTLPPELRDIVHRASELVRTRQLRLRETPLITSVTGIDRLLGGGLPRGTLVELVGRGSCGRFASLLAALKMVTDTGEVAALVDQGDQLDPQSAATVGIDLDRLLWLRPRVLPDALAATEMLVHTGFPLVALDLGLPPVRGRTPLAAWLRLARTAATHRAVVLVGSPYHLSGCAAAVVVTAHRGRGTWSGTVGTARLLHGIEARLDLARQRGKRPDGIARIAFTLSEAAFEPAVAADPDSKTEELSHVQAR